MADTNWDKLKASAGSGELALDPDAGAGFLKQMKEHLGALDSAMKGVSAIRLVGGFGNCPTGWALEGRFAKKADGGSDSLATQLRAHIAETQLIIDTVEQSIKNFRETDAQNSAKIKAKTRELT